MCFCPTKSYPNVVNQEICKGNENLSINAEHSGKKNFNIVSLRGTKSAFWFDVWRAFIYVLDYPVISDYEHILSHAIYGNLCCYYPPLNQSVKSDYAIT